MTIFCPPWVQFRDPDTDAPLDGGIVHFFQSGSSTPLNVYSDATLSTSIGSTATLDSFGMWEEADATYTDPAYSYKVVVTRSDGDLGSPILTIDPYDPQGNNKTVVQDVSGASKTYTSSDYGKITRRTHSSAMTDTLPTAAAAGSGAWVTIRNTTSAYNDVVTPTSGTIDGAASLTVYPGQDRTIRSNGSAWLTDPAGLTTGKRLLAAFDASALAKCTTSPPSDLVHGETTTNKIDYDAFPFDASSQEYVYGSFVLPKGYLAGTLEYRVRTLGSGTAGNTFTAGCAARAYGDDDAVDQAYGTAAEVSDTVLAVGDEQVSAWTAITPGNDGADRKVRFRLYRKASTGTLAGDLSITGIEFQGDLVRPNDA